MRLSLKAVAVAAALVLPCLALGCSAAAPDDPPAATATAPGEWMPLFNGTDLTGWETYLGPRLDADLEKIPDSVVGLNTDPDGVFTVTEEDDSPVIRISGVIGGGINTIASYENYHLRMDVKWGEGNPWNRTRADSGILYHAGGEHGVDGDYWKRSIEFQVMPDSHGDLITIEGCVADVTASPPPEGTRYVYDPNGEMHTFSRVSELTETGGAVSRLPSFEDPDTDWITMEIYSLGDTAVHVVGGQVVLVLHNVRLHENGVTNPLTSGQIQIQSEGSEVFYRNIELRHITALPEGLVPPMPM